MAWYDGLSGLAQTPDPTNDFGFRRGSKNYAKNTEAALLRANWDRSRATLEPILNRMSYMYSNPEGEQEAVQAAQGLSTGAFDKSVRSAERGLAGQGLQLTDAQKSSFDRSASLGRGMAQVGAMNQATRAHDDLKQQIAVGLS